jgi:Uma2 family endonuclease
MELQKKRVTVREFESIIDSTENQNRRLELIHGEIVEKMPTEEHGVITLRVGSRILAFVDTNDLGRVGVEIRHRVPKDHENSRLPDVSFTRKERLLPLVKKGSVQQMPDLAVEVKSPDDSEADLLKKADYYLRNGTRLVWLMLPDSKSVQAYTMDEGGNLQIQTFGVDDSLEGGDVLPGFILPVKDIFRE